MSDFEKNEHLNDQEDQEMHERIAVSGMYKNWFLDYASYVILDRAVPYLEDGLKPVQRRILHSMKDLDDGRFNKVANIIGHTMQYHPHGDAAIGDAIVNMGQKDLLIETQGNWGNLFTGDSAAAPRYIEARLSKFALEVVFNPQTTTWQLSYDGRKKEPVTLPVKFPLVLAQGVEGIAVGLSTRILPHNFVELIQASISHLKKRSFKLYPDFPTGGMIDVENYNDGERGGKVRIRAKIEEIDKKTLKITQVPYGTTTSSLIDSVIKANDKGKIKIKRIDDNTAKDVEIILHLAPGFSPNIAIDALYAFTDCETSVSPNCCIIEDDQPVFTDVKTVLKKSTDNTVDLLRRELEIKKGELEDKWHFSSLEKIFIENRIYRDIEECETWEAVIEAIDRGLDPFKKLLRRDVTQEDIVKLTEIKIKRISKYDGFKADELIKSIEDELAEVNHNLEHLTEYAISWFEHLLAKFGKGRERRTEIKAFDTIDATVVAVANEKLYVNRADGFIGTTLKKDEFVSECSDIDDVIVFRDDGVMIVTKVSQKAFVGKNIIHVDVFKKGDDRMVYHMIYRDGKSGNNYVKRFQVLAVTRDREYQLAGDKGKVLWFSANPNGESEVVTVYHKPKARLRKLTMDYDFAELDIKGRNSKGNTLSKHTIRKIELKSKGTSTLGGRDIWYDEVLMRLNVDENGQYLGNFEGEDRIIVLHEDGSYELTSFDLTNRYDTKGKILELHKLTDDTVISAIHYDGKNETYYLKRFKVETTSVNQKFSYISEAEGSRLLFATAYPEPKVRLTFNKKGGKRPEPEELELEEMIDVKGWKAQGNKVSDQGIKKVELVSAGKPEHLTENQEKKQPEKEEPEDDGNDDEGGNENPEGKGKDEVKKTDPKDIPMEVTNAKKNPDGSLTLFGD